MLKKLTRVKILILIIFLLVLIVKRHFIIELLQSKMSDQSSATVVKMHTKDKQGFDDKSQIAKLSIVVADIGLQSNLVEAATNTNCKISIGLTPYSDRLTSIAQESITKHDTMVLVPTQPLDYIKNDPGPSAMLMDLSAQENNVIFDNLITKIPSNKIGLYLSPKSVFTARDDKASFIIKLLEKHDRSFRFFMYYDRDKSNAMTKLLTMSSLAKKTIVVNKIISDNPDEVHLDLDDLKNLAKTQKRPMVAIITPQINALKALEEWLANNSKDVNLISISDILKTIEERK